MGWGITVLNDMLIVKTGILRTPAQWELTHTFDNYRIITYTCIGILPLKAWKHELQHAA